MADSRRPDRSAAPAEPEAALALCEEIVSLVSHDLRGPISSILTWVELMREGLSEEQRVRGLDALERGARAQQRIVQSIATFARLRAGTLPLAIEELDLRALVDRAAQFVAPWAKVKGVTLSIAGEVPSPVLGDADQLLLVLSHLIENAVKYSPDGQHVAIEIALAAAGGDAAVSIRDRGDGLEAGAAAELLQRALDDAPPGGRHRRGLGLALAVGLLQRQRGSLELASPGPKRGTTVRVTLPTAQHDPTTKTDAPTS